MERLENRCNREAFQYMEKMAMVNMQLINRQIGPGSELDSDPAKKYLDEKSMQVRKTEGGLYVPTDAHDSVNTGIILSSDLHASAVANIKPILAY